MKRAGRIFTKIISEGNSREAILTVVKSHRWIRYPDKPNKKALWLEATVNERAAQLKEMIRQGFIPSPCKKKRRYDRNAKKWRDISEPLLWPDQCVHHALIQVLQPVMMKGMDNYCCGSIKKRGTHYGIKHIKKWMGMKSGTKWCLEMDIRHFYDSIKPEIVTERMRELVKDRRAIDLVERIVKDGVSIGAYCSQWFANTLLQPLDREIRKCGKVKYVRYMDNFTVFAKDKRTLKKVVKTTKKWLKGKGLQLKGNWQYFKTSDRLPNALGYRYGKDIKKGKVYALLRKHALLSLKRQLGRYYKLSGKRKEASAKFAAGLLSRIGQLKHCSSTGLRQRIVKQGTMKELKHIIRKDLKKRESKKD